jgi:hypothetical protein
MHGRVLFEGKESPIQFPANSGDRARAREWIEHDVAGATAGANESCHQRFGLLNRV